MKEIIEKKKAALASFLNEQCNSEIIPSHIQPSHITMEKDSEEDGAWYVYPLMYRVYTAEEWEGEEVREEYFEEHEFEGEVFYIIP